MTSESDSIDDELLAVGAIFGDAVEVSPATIASPARVVVTLPWGEGDRAEPVAATFTRTPAGIWVVEYEGFPRGTVPEVQRRVASVQADSPLGSPVLFILVNELRAAVDDICAAGAAFVSVPRKRDLPALGSTDGAGEARPPAVAVPIFHGALVIQQKSTFQAHVAPVHSRADVTSVLSQLYADSHVARATHNMCECGLRSVGHPRHSTLALSPCLSQTHIV